MENVTPESVDAGDRGQGPIARRKFVRITARGMEGVKTVTVSVGLSLLAMIARPKSVELIAESMVFAMAQQVFSRFSEIKLPIFNLSIAHKS